MGIAWGVSASGAFKATGNDFYGANQDTAQRFYHLNFNANWSDDTYGKSGTVTPESMCSMVLIKFC